MKKLFFICFVSGMLSLAEGHGGDGSSGGKPPAGPTDQEQIDALKDELMQQRDNTRMQCQEILKDHEAQIEELEAEHKGQIDSWNSQDKDFQDRMKALVDEYKDRFKQVSEKDRKKLNEELKAKLNALSEELHADNKQAVDKARQTLAEMVKVRHDEIEALTATRKAEFELLRKEFERKHAQTPNQVSGSE